MSCASDQVYQDGSEVLMTETLIRCHKGDFPYEEILEFVTKDWEETWRHADKTSDATLREKRVNELDTIFEETARKVKAAYTQAIEDAEKTRLKFGSEVKTAYLKATAPAKALCDNIISNTDREFEDIVNRAKIIRDSKIKSAKDEYTASTQASRGEYERVLVNIETDYSDRLARVKVLFREAKDKVDEPVKLATNSRKARSKVWRL